MIRFSLPLALLLPLSGAPAVAASVQVVDGDTLRIDGVRTRLWGFDAPERAQLCTINGIDRAIGQEAGEGLAAILASGELRCRAHGHDQHGRPVMECWAGAVSIGDAMVRLGWAWAEPEFSGTRYLPAQREAERARRGVWAGHANCETPARFRQEHRHQ